VACSQKCIEWLTDCCVPGNAVPTGKITLGTPFPGVPAGNDPWFWTPTAPRMDPPNRNIHSTIRQWWHCSRATIPHNGRCISSSSRTGPKLELSGFLEVLPVFCLSLETALIQSRLDYSNSVLYGTSVSNLHKLQMAQNALARTVTRSPRSVPTSQLLSNLHWLPIHKRIIFKVAILTYKVLSTQQPAYLYNLISYHQTTQSFAAFLQSVSPPSAQGKNRFRTSCFFLCCSSNLESYTCRQ